MTVNNYRANFIFDIAEVYRYLIQLVEPIIDEKGWSHRVASHQIAEAWLQHYLEKEIAIAVHPTEQSWASAFFTPELMNDQFLPRFCYRLFSEALHPTTHPCFHHPASLFVTQHDLRLEYVVPYKDIA